MQRERKKYRLGRDATLETNIEGFELLRGDKLRDAIMSLPDDDPIKVDLLKNRRADA